MGANKLRFFTSVLFLGMATLGYTAAQPHHPEEELLEITTKKARYQAPQASGPSETQAGPAASPQDDASNAGFFGRLPNEMTLHILSFLSLPQDLINFGVSCKHNYRLLTSPKVIKSLTIPEDHAQLRGIFASAIPELKTLRLNSKFLPFSIFRPHLRALTHLNIENVGNTDFSEEDFAYILDSLTSPHSSLEILQLWRLGLDENHGQAIADALRGNTKLRELNLFDNRLKNPGALAILQALKTNENLTSLSLRSNGIDGSDELTTALKDVLENHPKLMSLNLSFTFNGCSFPTHNDINAIAEALKVKNTLRSLNLSETTGSEWTDKKVYFFVCKLPRAADDDNLASAGDESFSNLASALEQNTSLTTLNLAVTDLCDERAIIIAEVLKKNRSLISIDLAQNFIQYSGLQAIAEALKINTTLKELILAENAPDRGQASGFQVLAQALADNKTLTTLDLSSNQLEDGDVQAIAQALTLNTTLRSLNLAHNFLQYESLAAIADALKVNTALTSLDLSSTQLEDTDGQAIAHALTLNRTLKKLDLSDNPALTARVKSRLTKVAKLRGVKVIL